jgi:hypothetical protein
MSHTGSSPASDPAGIYDGLHRQILDLDVELPMSVTRGDW